MEKRGVEMKIVAKASEKIEQLNDRINKGFKYIELQLTEDFIKEDINIYSYLKNVLSENFDVVSVHMPLMKGEDINLEYLSYEKYKISFENCCKLSNEIGKYYKHDITIVLHNNFNLDMYERMPILFDTVVNTLFKMLNKYDNINISLENVLPITEDYNTVFFRNTNFDENVRLTKYLNKMYGKTRFYNTLDICHALSHMEFLKAYSIDDTFKKYMLNLEDYFIAFKDTINNIHLNNIKSFGVGKGKHGTGFDKDSKEDMMLLNEIMELYKKYNYSCNLVIETNEEDYNNAVIAENVKNILESSIQKLT